MNNTDNQNNNNELKDFTKNFSSEEIKNGKVMSLLSYISILALIPYLTEKQNGYVKFHAKQGMNLLIYEAIFSMIDTVLVSLIPGLAFIAHLCVIVMVAFSLIGIVFVLNNEARELPFMDKIGIIK